MNPVNYFSNLDLRKTRDTAGIHFEQKITPDLLWCVAEVILDLVSVNSDTIFTDDDIRRSSFFISTMREYFTKPGQIESTENEYNKVSSYQLGFLAFCRVLAEIENRPKAFRVVNLDVLRYLSLNDRNVLNFLEAYVDKFIIDNNLEDYFDEYQHLSTQRNYVRLKDKYWEWAQENTGVRTKNPQHSYRVFNKIFNIYAHNHRLPGESGSRVRPGVCPYEYLVYNRKNFRDAYMPEGMSRREYVETIQLNRENSSVLSSLVARSKHEIRRRHSVSEVNSPEESAGIHVHHIFPDNEYPQFSYFKENLIALTPGQHFSNAHLQANTLRINTQYQIVCLLAKLRSISESIRLNDSFYNIRNLIFMLNRVFGLNLSEDSQPSIIQSRLEQML